MTQLIPCRDPKLCGVQNHYPNTESKCSATKGGKTAGAKALAAPSSSPHLDGLKPAYRRAIIANRPDTPLVGVKTASGGLLDPPAGWAWELYERDDDEDGVIIIGFGEDEDSNMLRKTYAKVGASGQYVGHRDPEHGPSTVVSYDDGQLFLEDYRSEGTLCPRPDGGPSVIEYDWETGDKTSQIWVNESGAPHRTDGPAIVKMNWYDPQDFESYFLDGKKYDSKEEYEAAVTTYGN